jgi:protein-disulfide isomerase/uncharacterized membrane protein
MPETAQEAPHRGSAPATWLVLCRASALVALAASAALYFQYLNPAQATFCGLNSGCEAVRKSGLSYFGSPLLSIPLVGLIAYATVLWFLVAAPRGRAALWLTTAGGAGGLILIGVQALYVHAFCWLCVVADLTGVLGALFVLLDRRAARAGGVIVEPLRKVTWGALALLVTALPAGWARVKPAPPVPPVVLSLYVPGKINVVEFADFECPYCRRLHPMLKRVMQSYPAGQIHFVRRHVPLPGHEEALPAARAAVCAEEQGLGEALADRLVDLELSPSAERRAAVGVGVDVDRFDRCLESTAPDLRIQGDRKVLEEAGMLGLPTTYVQGKRLLGAVPEEVLRDAFDLAARGETDAGVPGSVFGALGLGALAVVVWLGRAPRARVKDERAA